MKLKNFKLNKKRIYSLLIAGGMCLCNASNSEIISYNSLVTTKEGDMATVYFSKIINDIKYAYISTDNMTGFVYENELNMDNASINNYFTEDNESLTVQDDIAYLYKSPNIDDTRVVTTLKKNDVVDVLAKTNNGWYIVYTNGTSGFMHENSFTINSHYILVAKLKKNNVNVRSTSSITKDNIIGFADKSDSFKILDKENGWYKIDYLGQTGYINEDFILEEETSKEDFEISRIAYLTCDAFFYTDLDTKDGIYLPAYQNIGIISEYGSYYKVNVDGVVGYILKKSVKKLSRTCVIIDLSRQLLRVYKNGKESFRSHIISGRESMQTQIGCFKIGHKLMDYWLTDDNHVDYWIQYDGNRGIHDASWQKDAYYYDVANIAYENYSKGKGTTYPFKHGSHGCDNMMLKDVIEVYRLVNVGDNVLVIGPNDLIKNRIISENNYSVNTVANDNIIKVKKLV